MWWWNGLATLIFPVPGSPEISSGGGRVPGGIRSIVRTFSLAATIRGSSPMNRAT